MVGNAQPAAPAAPPDVLISKSGEKFVGHLLNSDNTYVVFQSDAAGKVTIAWRKVQELQSSATFAVVPKNVRLRDERDEAKVPQGTLAVTGEQVQVTPTSRTAPQTVPVSNVNQVVSEEAFQRALRPRNLLHGWAGGATAGLAYTSSTQTSQTYTAALNLARAIPGETWLDQKSRTVLGLNEAYGEISQRGTSTSKTSILHVGVEHDRYVNPRLFLFGQALFDHNYSQGLDLQQDYGGGLGYVVIKNAKREFDIKASVDYIDQQFSLSSQNQSLIGSTFGEEYVYHFPYKIVFTENGNYIPAWNNTKAFSSNVNANLTFPVYRHFGLTIGGIDNFLNDPPIGFKKNSFTLTMGATYSLQ